MSVKQDLIAGEFFENMARTLMGSKKYDEWIQSQEVNKYSNFKNFDEVKKYVLKAGYDFKRIETSKYIYLKTHLSKNDEDCIYWIMRHDKVTASLTVSVNDKNLKKFIEMVETVVGKQCFFDSVDDADKLPEQIFSTTFSNKNTLKESMQNVGLTVKEKNGALTTTLDNCLLILQDSENTNFEFKVIGYANLSKIHKCFQKIETEYCRIVQKNICAKIREKVENSNNMEIESEEYLEDNSILLTINV